MKQTNYEWRTCSYKIYNNTIQLKKIEISIWQFCNLLKKNWKFDIFSTSASATAKKRFFTCNSDMYELVPCFSVAQFVEPSFILGNREEQWYSVKCAKSPEITRRGYELHMMNYIKYKSLVLCRSGCWKGCELSHDYLYLSYTCNFNYVPQESPYTDTYELLRKIFLKC